MKCTKCGYTSFDYEQVCPKCNKDISAEREKMNLPSYKNDPPSLLGSLISRPDDSDIDFVIERPVMPSTLEPEMGTGSGGSQEIGSLGGALNDSEGIGIDIKPVPGGEPEELQKSIDLEDLSLESAEIEPEEEKPATVLPFKEDAETDLILKDDIEGDLTLADDIEESFTLEDDAGEDLTLADSIEEDLILGDDSGEDLLLVDDIEEDLILEDDSGEDLLLVDDVEELSLEVEDIDFEKRETKPL